MKNWKSILITFCCFFTIAGMVFFSACVKDPCLDLTCQNGGSCSDGFCQCPTGFEGAECDITAASRFVGTWKGADRCNNFPLNPSTVTISVVKEPNEIELKMGAGGTILTGFRGTAATPETHFNTYEDNDVIIHAYITVDGPLLQLYLQTISKTTGARQNCYFAGERQD